MSFPLQNKKIISFYGFFFVVFRSKIGWRSYTPLRRKRATNSLMLKYPVLRKIKPLLMFSMICFLPTKQLISRLMKKSELWSVFKMNINPKVKYIIYLSYFVQYLWELCRWKNFKYIRHPWVWFWCQSYHCHIWISWNCYKCYSTIISKFLHPWNWWGWSRHSIFSHTSYWNSSTTAKPWKVEKS